jgi:hypothetical protein
MIKTLRKLQGKRTHISVAVSTVGAAIAASGIGIDPQTLVTAVTGAVDLVNGTVQTIDAVKEVDLTQVSAGMVLTVVGNLAAHYFRHRANK